MAGPREAGRRSGGVAPWKELLVLNQFRRADQRKRIHLSRAKPQRRKETVSWVLCAVAALRKTKVSSYGPSLVEMGGAGVRGGGETAPGGAFFGVIGGSGYFPGVPGKPVLPGGVEGAWSPGAAEITAPWPPPGAALSLRPQPARSAPSKIIRM